MANRRRFVGLLGIAVLALIAVAWVMWRTSQSFPDTTAALHELRLTPAEFEVVSESGRCRAGRSEVAAVSLASGGIEWRHTIPFAPFQGDRSRVPTDAALTEAGLVAGYWGLCQPAGLITIDRDGELAWQAIVSGRPWLTAVGDVGALVVGRDPSGRFDSYQLSIVDPGGRLVATHEGTPRPADVRAVNNRGIAIFENRSVWFMDLESGEQLAAHKLPSQVKAVLIKDRVVFLAIGPGVRGYSLDGELLSSFDVPVGVEILDLVDIGVQDAVIIARVDGERLLGAVNIESGELGWTTPVPADASVRASDNAVAARGRARRGVFVVDRATGLERSIVPGDHNPQIGSELVGSTLSNHELLLLTRAGQDYLVHSYDLDGHEQWTMELPGQPLIDPHLVGDTVLLAGRGDGDDGYVVSLDRASGATIWETQPHGAGSVLFVEAGTVYVITGGEFYRGG